MYRIEEEKPNYQAINEQLSTEIVTLKKKIEEYEQDILDIQELFDKDKEELLQETTKAEGEAKEVRREKS